MSLLQVKDLGVRFATLDGQVQAVNGVSFELERGQTLGIVGESGSGKSQSVLAMMGLLAKNGKATSEALYQGKNLLTMTPRELNRIRGDRVSMIFQDPMTSLNPYLTVERQMTEVLELHKGMRRKEAKKRAIELLEAVRIPDAARRIDMYPHEFSGGMRQRVMIAMALSCNPKLLIADEPTTALDVTIQAQILDLLGDLKARMGMAVMLITHAMGVIAETAQRVVVMYAGHVVEEAPVGELFRAPRHPYTQGLIRSIPRIDAQGARKQRLAAIPGVVPSLVDPRPGCRFAPRCPHAGPECAATPPLREIAPGHRIACVRA